MSLSLVTGPTQEPVTIEEAKQHMRIEVSADDAMVAAFVLAAREWVEGQIKRSLITQTFDYFIDWDWPTVGYTDRIMLPINPVQSVASISYIDDNGATQTLAASQYTVVARESGSYVEPAYNVDWPSVRCVPNAIVVRFTAGYIDTTTSPQVNKVPFPLRTAVLMMAAHMYENREATTVRNINEAPLAVETLISPYRDARFQ